MKRLKLKYTMARDREVRVASITVPMTDERAEHILTDGGKSIYLQPGGSVYRLLCELSLIQDWDYQGFVDAESV